MKEISHEEILQKIFSSAYCFKNLGYYGSKEKAVKALTKRKGFENYSFEFTASMFEQALQVFVDATDFMNHEMVRKTPLTQLTDKDVNRIMNNLKITLLAKNSRVPKEFILHALNWVYLNYYLR